MKKVLLLLSVVLSFNVSAAKLKLVCLTDHSDYVFSVVATRSYAKITKLKGFGAIKNPSYYLNNSEFRISGAFDENYDFLLADFKHGILYSCELDNNNSAHSF